MWTTAHVCYFWRKTKTALGTMTNTSPINKAQKRSFVSPSDCKPHTIQETGNIYSMTKSLNIHWDVRPWQPIWMSSNCCPPSPHLLSCYSSSSVLRLTAWKWELLRLSVPSSLILTAHIELKTLGISSRENIHQRETNDALPCSVHLCISALNADHLYLCHSVSLFCFEV